MADLSEEEIKKMTNQVVTERLRNLGVFESDDAGVIRTRANFEFVDTLRREVGFKKLQEVISYVEEIIINKQKRNKTFTDFALTALANSFPILIPAIISGISWYWFIKK